MCEEGQQRHQKAQLVGANESHLFSPLLEPFRYGGVFGMVFAHDKAE